MYDVTLWLSLWFYHNMYHIIHDVLIMHAALSDTLTTTDVLS